MHVEERSGHTSEKDNIKLTLFKEAYKFLAEQFVIVSHRLSVRYFKRAISNPKY